MRSMEDECTQFNKKRRLDEDLYRIECELELLAVKAPMNVLQICNRIKEMLIVKQAAE